MNKTRQSLSLERKCTLTFDFISFSGDWKTYSTTFGKEITFSKPAFGVAHEIKSCWQFGGPFKEA